MSDSEIMIVGGFNGKFLSDYYVLKVGNGLNPEQVQRFERQNSSVNLFPFQVPTVGDAARR